MTLKKVDILLFSQLTKRFLLARQPSGALSVPTIEISLAGNGPVDVDAYLIADATGLAPAAVHEVSMRNTAAKSPFTAAFTLNEPASLLPGHAWVSIDTLKEFPKKLEALLPTLEEIAQRDIEIEYDPKRSNRGSHTSLASALAVNGSKHAYSRLVAYAELFPQYCTLTSVPDTVDAALIGQVMALSRTHTGTVFEIPDELTERSWSIINLVPVLLKRHGAVSFRKPKGCRIGTRPIDWYLDICRAFGCTVTDNGSVTIKHDGFPESLELTLPKPSFTGTSLALCFAAWYAVATKRSAVLHNLSEESEILELRDAMNRTACILTPNRERSLLLSARLRPKRIVKQIETDRNVVFTAMCAAMLAGKSADYDALGSFEEAIPLVESLGWELCLEDGHMKLSGDRFKKTAGGRHSFGFHPLPGSDWQPLYASTAAVLGADCTVRDEVFEDRYGYIEELERMFPAIAHAVEDGNLIVKSRNQRDTSDATQVSVCARDLRCGAALMLGCLRSDRKVRITNITQIFRGYSNPVELMNAIEGGRRFRYVQS